MEEQYNVKRSECGLELPPIEELTPLTQSLISPELALAFGINSEPPKRKIDLNVALDATYSTNCSNDESNSVSKESNGDDSGLSRAAKRPRVVWTPELHKHFVDVIQHVGLDKAVPKTIMEMMNVDGITRENVASHLQKYRLYLKRIDPTYLGPKRAPSMFECQGFGSVPMQVPMQPQPIVHPNGLPLMPMMPMVGPSAGPYGLGHMGFPGGNSGPNGYCGLESGGYNMFWNRRLG